MRKIYSTLLVAVMMPAGVAIAANEKGGVPAPHPTATKTISRLKPNSAKVRHVLPDPGSAHLGGVVLTNAGEALPGATIFIKGTYVGTSTNQEGRFDLNGSFANGPVELVISFVGYETQTVVLDKPDDQMSVSLVPSATMLTETVVSASRVEENIMRAPVTIDKVSAQQIERISTPEVMAGLGQLAGVDVNSASMLFTSISTRGFNTAKSERVIQLVDYMDTALPSLNLSPGNMVGIPELDMESIEIVHGPASALYGSNALSGVVLFNSKDPFVYEGLSARVRGGQRSLMDGQLRYAKKLGNRFAFKVNASYFKAYDWIAANYSPTAGSINPQGSPQGYDAINRYGELEKKFTQYTGTNGELNGRTIDMRGYTERELVGNDSTTRSYRIQGAISYLINNDLKLTAEYKRGVGTATYQNFSRFRIKDLGTNQYRLELKSSKGFIRAYSTMDFTGSTYEFASLAGQILRSPTVDNPATTYQELYFKTYNNAYTAARATKSVDESLALAHAAADATQPQVGSSTYNSIRNRIAADVDPKTGAGQYFSSYLHDISGQRNFRLGGPNTALIVGGAYRQYRLGSDGLLFDDQDGKRIMNYEYGGYAQITQSLFDDHLKLAAAGRLDYFKNFNPALSPRFAAVYSFGARKQHSLRASYGQAFRSPSQTDQYLHSDPGTFILLGNIGNGFQGYRFPDATHPFNPFTSKSADFEISIDKLRLERANTLEGGYKGAIIPNLYVDASAFVSKYHDFIGGYYFAGNVDGSRPTFTQYYQALNGAQNNVRIIFVSQNNSQLVQTYGASFAMTYYLNKGLNLTGNYSLNVIDRSNLPDGFRTFFNTPKHKFNIGANGTVAHNLNYSINYRWVQGHYQELPFNVGNLTAARTLDTYLGYTVPKLASTFQIGGSNILNDTNIQVIGGPQLGRLVYLGLQVNVK